MAERRPDPDQLLERLRRRAERERRAKLKLFFGSAAGVGKTYAMLLEAHERQAAGTDVAAGVVETHGREETARLLEGLERIPLAAVTHRGTTLREFDLDAALQRAPDLVLVDELAHTNAPGSRHAKRWQDVEELLNAGIDVYSTLNVQHVESLNDVVHQITGVVVRETVPDSILDRADEIELIDLPSDDLLQRLREGKVYIPEQAEAAMRNFFRKVNLIALRELALRRTAERVDREMESYRDEAGIAEPWAVSERILVCLGDPDQGIKLVRAARRMAGRRQAQWIVVHIETPAELRWPRERRDYIVDVLGFAEDLGAEIVVRRGIRVADEVLALAHERNVSRILVGKPSAPRWRQLFRGSLANALVRRSEEIDVYVISGEAEGEAPTRGTTVGRALRWTHYVQALLVLAAGTGLAWLMFPYFALTNLVMVYLLGVMIVALWLGRGPAVLASIASVIAFDFFFVPPRFTFAVSDTQYLVTFVVMLVAGLALSTMANWLGHQTDAARQRERRTATLYRMGRELAAMRDRHDLLETAARLIGEELESPVTVFLPDEGGRLRPEAGDRKTLRERQELGVAQWAFDNGLAAGFGTSTLPASEGLYVPLRGSGGPIGVLGTRPGQGGGGLHPDPFGFLLAMADQLALALERSQLAEAAERSRLQVESERLRNTLLSSVSHDIRTPLAVISGAAATLLENRVDEATRRELTATIAEEAQRLSGQVGNLLDMTRLEAGPVELKREWHSLEELVGSALERLQRGLAGREVRVDVSAAPFLPVDEHLFGQVLFNLVENAVKYTPAGSPIDLVARPEETGGVVIEVADRGPGLVPGEEQRVFEKFYRGQNTARPLGIGLGLAICREIVAAHGGRMEAAQRPGGGAVFRIWLPVEGEPPRLEPETTEGPAALSPENAP